MNSTATSVCMLLAGDPSVIGHVESASLAAPAHLGRPRRAGSERATKSKIEKAIYSHIRAVRALGRKEITTAEIAEALSLSVKQVNAAIGALKSKGVKVL